MNTSNTVTRTRTTDMDKWEQIGEKTKRMKREILDLDQMLTDVPEQEYRGEVDDLDRALSELRDKLEKQMFAEHRELDDDALSIFYGSLESNYRGDTRSVSTPKWTGEADD